jgi:hypothetical protein
MRVSSNSGLMQEPACGGFCGDGQTRIACRQAPTQGLKVDHAQTNKIRKSKFKDNIHLNFK